MALHKFEINVDTLDNAMWPAYRHALQPPNIALLKIDAQGFEVKLLQGAQRLLAARAIKAIKTELAGNWLKAQGTSPRKLCALLEFHGFKLSNTAGPVSLDECERTGEGISDLYAVLA